MKTIFTKKTTIALIATNLAMASYIVKEKAFRHGRSKSHVARETDGEGRRRGSVEPVYFRNADELQGCYESYLSLEPAHDEGSVLVNVRIAPSGAIDSLKLVENDFNESSFTECIVEKLKATRMPASDGTVTVAHRFNFRRKTAGEIHFER
jgi:hypothetical protein